MAEYEPRNFIQPCLLLLLRERSDHGYDLIDRLRVLHAVDGDAGAVYRALRGMEKAGMVRSTWETSDTGPARRTYRVTPLGVAALDRQAHILEETHRILHLFRRRYLHLPAGMAGPGSDPEEMVPVGWGDGPAHGNGSGPHGVPGARDAGVSKRRNGDGGDPAGGGPGDPGGRGVRPARVPGRRTGH